MAPRFHLCTASRPVGLLVYAPLGLLTLFAFAATPVLADEIPPIYHITVTPDYDGSVLVAPGPINGTTYTVTIRDDLYQPMPGLVVEFLFHTEIRICAGAVHHGVTDENGSCQITLRAGGCIPHPTPGACEVRANGVQIYMFEKVKSPDNASNDASEPNGLVNVADLVFFAQEFRGQVTAGCHDYTNDGQTSTADLPTFGDAFKLALTCTLQ
jgi:hypothetical protein